MGASVREWPKSTNEIIPHQPEPVITYDHMSDVNHPLYISAREKVPYMYVILDSIILLTLLTAQAYVSFLS